MAAIRNRNYLWQTNHSSETLYAHSFQAKQDAEHWASQAETQIDKDSFLN